MSARSILVALALGGLAGLGHAEASLQDQIDSLRKDVERLKVEKEPSEPIELIKAVTEWVSPSGELFTERQKGDVSPTDGSPLTERQTFRKMKFSRHQSVSEKIDAAIAGAIDGHVVVGMSMIGLYQNFIGAGDVLDNAGNTRSANT